MKLIKRLITIILLLIIVVCGYVIYDGYRLYQSALEETSLESAINEIKSKEHYTLKADIPESYFDALIAVEDRRFYRHKGFDAIGTIRAIVNDIKAKQLLEGGSTLTQQLAKNLYFPLDASIQRKIAEIFMALEIENCYSKDEILEVYVNCVYYGSGYYCIYDASSGYFNKIPSDMNLFECTLLVGIPNAPSVYSLDVNPELAMQRQLQVVNAMVDCEYIDENTAELILELQNNYTYGINDCNYLTYYIKTSKIIYNNIMRKHIL